MRWKHSSTSLPPATVCRDGRVPDGPHALSFLMADRKGLSFADTRSSSLPRFHLLLLSVAHLKSSLSPDGLVVLPRAASCARAAVGRATESGRASGWQPPASFYVSIHSFSSL